VGYFRGPDPVGAPLNWTSGQTPEITRSELHIDRQHHLDAGQANRIVEQLIDRCLPFQLAGFIRIHGPTIGTAKRLGPADTTPRTLPVLKARRRFPRRQPHAKGRPAQTVPVAFRGRRVLVSSAVGICVPSECWAGAGGIPQASCSCGTGGLVLAHLGHGVPLVRGGSLRGSCTL
jgi:hypothetical protein